MKSIKYILALLLIIPAGFVFAQTIVTVSQPVATSWNDFGGTKLTSLSQANTPHLNDNGLIANIYGTTQLDSVELIYGFLRTSGNDSDTNRIIIHVRCYTDIGELCPVGNNVDEHGYVIYGTSQKYAKQIFHSGGSPAGSQNMFPGFVDVFGDPLNIASYTDTITFDNTNHDFNPDNIYRIEVQQTTSKSSPTQGRTLHLYGTNTDLTPDSENPISLGLEVAFGILATIDTLAIAVGADFLAGGEQGLSKLTGAFFKPYYSLQISTTYDFQAIALAYYNQNYGVGVQGISFTCSQIESVSCSLTDVACGVQKGICQLFIGDIDSNFEAFTENLGTIRNDRLPTAYFFKIKDAWDNSSISPSFILGYSPNAFGLLDGTFAENLYFQFADLGNLAFTNEQNTVLLAFEDIMRFFLVITIIMFVLRSIRI